MNILDTINDRLKKKIINFKATKIPKVSREYQASSRQRGTEIAFQAHRAGTWFQANEFINEKNDTRF